MTESIKVSVDFGPVPTKVKNVDAVELVTQAAIEAINLAGPFVARKLAENTPVGATGKARQSVNFEPAKAKGLGHVVGFIGYGAPASLYIGYANDGTRPHRPPVTPLVYWAARVTGDPRVGYKMVRWISIYGTRAQHFVEDTRDEVEDRARQMMRNRFVSYFEEEL